VTTALAVVEQSELARLVQEREELQDELKGVKNHLKRLQYWSVESTQDQRTRRRGYQTDREAVIRLQVSQAKTSLADFRAYEQDRLRVLALVEHDKLRELLERHNQELNIVRLERDIEDQEEKLQEIQEELAKNDEPIIDPRVEVTESMAAIESRLTEVRAAIRDLMPKGKK
jgi:hypothetical protein